MYGLAFLRITAWVILIVFCLVCFESSVTELNRIIKESRPHFDGLTLDQTRDFLVVYLIFGVLYVLIDGKLNNPDWFFCSSLTHSKMQIELVVVVEFIDLSKNRMALKQIYVR